MQQLEVINGVDVVAALPHDDGQHLVAIAVHANGAAIKGAFRGIAQIFERGPRPAGAGLIKLGHLHQHFVTPIGAGDLGPGVPFKDLQGTVAKPPQDVRVGGGRADDARLKGPCIARADAEAAGKGRGLGVVFTQPRARHIRNLGNDRVIRDIHDDLRIGRVGRLGVHGQIEPRRPRPDKARHGGNILLLGQDRLKLGNGGIDGFDPGAFGGVEVDHEFRHGGGREEKLRHRSKADHRRHKRRNRNANRQEPDADRGLQNAAIGPEKRRLFRIFGLGLRLGQEHHALQGRDGHGQKPAHQKRQPHHRKQRAAVFARALDRGKDRVERHDRHKCRPKQRDRRALGRINRGLHPVHPLGHANACAIGHNDRIVDHHAQRNDQRAQRHALQINAEHRQRNEGGQNGQDQPRSDDDPHAQAHRQRQHNQHNRNRLPQTDQEARHGGIHIIGLPVHLADLDPHGQLGLQLGQPGIDGLTNLDHIHPRLERQRDPNRGLAVKPHQGGGGIDVILADGAQIPQSQNVRALRILHLQPVQRAWPQGQLGNVFGGFKGAGGRDTHPVVAHIHAPGIDHRVLRGQGVDDCRPRNAQRGKRFLLHINIDRAVLHAPQADTPHPFDKRQLALQIFGIIAQLVMREPVGGERDDKARHIPEIVIDRRTPGTWGQLGFDVADLAAQRVPDLGQLVRPVIRPDLDHDRRDTGAAFAGDIVDFLDFLKLTLDRFGDFLFHLFRPRPRIGGDDHSRFDRELRVFELAQRVKAADAAKDHQYDREPRKFGIADGEAGQIHYCASSSIRRIV